jgi:hypothetical protein
LRETVYDGAGYHLFVQFHRSTSRVVNNVTKKANFMTRNWQHRWQEEPPKTLRCLATKHPKVKNFVLDKWA